VTRKVWLCVIICLLTLGRVEAAPPTGADVLIEMEPAEVWTYACRFPSTKTLSSCASTTVLRVERTTDAAPTAIVTATAANGSRDCNVTVAPDTSCGTVGCRAGNVYQVVTTGTFSDGNKLLCNVRVDVRRVRFQP
jgi:hypothetical protein